MSVKQILIFDSGVGGLSVFKKIINENMSADCYYLFDNAYFPYGELADDVLIKRLILLLDTFVLQYKTDLIVIACNSASTVALSALRHHFSIPIVGVVPAIKPASLISKNNVIGLLATPATVTRNYTDELIAEFAKNKQVLKIGTTKLVELAEQKLQGESVDLSIVQSILKPWLDLSERPDTIVLGCTHFPLLKKEIAFCFDDNVQLVDSGDAIAKRVYQQLNHKEIGNREKQHHAFYTQCYSTDKLKKRVEQRFIDYGFKAVTYFEIDASMS